MTAKQIHSQKNHKDDVQTHKYMNSRGWVKKFIRKRLQKLNEKKKSPVPTNIYKIQIGKPNTFK